MVTMDLLLHWLGWVQARQRVFRGIGAVLLGLTLSLSLATAHALEIDVNAASVEDLRSIRGVGPQLAERIVRERLRGPFRDLEDLRARVRGIGERTAHKLVKHGLRVRAPSGLSDNPPRALPRP